MTCELCGIERRQLQRDHIVCRWEGGSDDESNIQRICANCHEDKSIVDTRRYWDSPQGKAMSAELGKNLIQSQQDSAAQSRRGKLGAAKRMAAGSIVLLNNLPRCATCGYRRSNDLRKPCKHCGEV